MGFELLMYITIKYSRHLLRIDLIYINVSF